MTNVDKAFREERARLALVDLRQCIQCGETKTLSAEFGNDKNGAGGKSGHCRDCHRARMRAWHHKNDGLQGALDSGLKRARTAGALADSIKPVELLAYWKKNGIDPWKCFYTGKPLVKGQGHPHSREIDHIEPLSLKGSAGHVMRNIVPCSHEWNRYKYNRRAVAAYRDAPEELQPIMSYAGYADGHAGVDFYGSPWAPAIAEWLDSDHNGEFVVYVRQDAEVTQ
ncbi:HNH endonuclease domain-containing protein [Corynebacterium nasicanis]|uniref:HNH endonuclease domain-containing protein n=1 Tax=Corynebacterium nasicanis TaxID=1448267 RepID=A0ABW1QFD8_9CORY